MAASQAIGWYPGPRTQPSPATTTSRPEQSRPQRPAAAAHGAARPTRSQAARQGRSRLPPVRPPRARLRPVCGGVTARMTTPGGRNRSVARTPSRRARLRRVIPIYGGAPGRTRLQRTRLRSAASRVARLGGGSRPQARRRVGAGCGSAAARRTSPRRPSAGPVARRGRSRLPPVRLPPVRLPRARLRPVCGGVSARMTRPRAGLVARRGLRRGRRVVLGFGDGMKGTRSGPGGRPPALGRVTLSSLDRGRAVPGSGAGPARARTRLGRPGTRPAVVGRAGCGGVTERTRNRGKTK